ncbi:hypothetical protein BDK89_3839 [Ilumatobacter fluminis]|uniref:Uncharacterized protein n=1 Tax=Ilumatobacter fluminis TaxID=467091 RepID=A0A4R7I3Q5_9ACTN|nr:hypothetical protein [Ilumatobacter fluminis]TDT18221.1 hypothetical protein BDK89_3839 [Ilumatobacter fluminis]
MTTRSNLDHMRKELGASVFGFLANKGLSRKTKGVDGLAKSMIARQAGEVAHDPELDHPEEWDRPVD